MQTKQIETVDVQEFVEHHDGNKTKAAEAIGISRTTLRKHLGSPNLILVKDGDELKPYFRDQQYGHHKKGN